MRHDLMDILACPVCKGPLTLHRPTGGQEIIEQTGNHGGGDRFHPRPHQQDAAAFAAPLR